MQNNKIEGSIFIDAPVAKIWDTLTNPEKIIQYLGSHTETDWKVGSEITWSGEMHGTPFQNKGEVLENKPEKSLIFTYWSGMGGDSDQPENYSVITYRLEEADNHQIDFTYTRANIPTEMETQVFEQYLPNMLEAIKQVAEG